MKTIQEFIMAIEGHHLTTSVYHDHRRSSSQYASQTTTDQLELQVLELPIKFSAGVSSQQNRTEQNKKHLNPQSTYNSTIDQTNSK